MDNQGRTPEHQKRNEKVAFIATAGLAITVLLILIKLMIYEYLP
jgi:hypothetical protein